MKYAKKERLEIGRRIYEGKISRNEAAIQYGISTETARDYMRLYRDAHSLPAKRGTKTPCVKYAKIAVPTGLEDYKSMTKEELIHELVKARITEARLKKGYMVKGDGADKEYILYDSKNIK